MKRFKDHDIIKIIDNHNFKFDNSESFTEQRIKTSEAKIDEIIDYTKNLLDQDKNVILLFVHRSILDKIKIALADYNPLFHTAMESNQVRWKNIDEFNQNKSKLLVASVNSLEGFKFSKDCTCQDMVFAELSNSFENQQAKARFKKFDQNKNYYYHYLILTDGTDPIRANKIFNRDIIREAKMKNFLKECDE